MATEDEIFYGGAKGGGKSDVVVARPLKQVHKEFYKALILRETYGELEDLLSRARRIYNAVSYRPEWQAKHSQYVWPSGAIVKFGHCARLEHVQRYQGQEWAEIYVDEAANLRDPKVREELLKEIRCKNPQVNRCLFLTGNPGYAGHAWCKRRYISPTRYGKVVYTTTDQVPGLGTITRRVRFIPARVTDNPVYANDLTYMSALHSLPDARRRQLLDGDWDVGFGLALPELDQNVHMVNPFRPPAHWQVFGGYDWGYQHPWCYPLAVVDEDGNVVVVDTRWGRMMLPHDIGESMVAFQAEHGLKPTAVASGHDNWYERRAHGETGPTTAEKIMGLGVPLVKANQDRVAGLTNLQEYLAWQNRLGPGINGDPGLRFMRTAGNLRLFEQLETMVLDPDDPRKALKVDADPETGEGGDDGYDALRYGMSSRPQRARSLLPEQQARAWSPEVLRHEADVLRRVKHPKPPKTVGDPANMGWVP